MKSSYVLACLIALWIPQIRSKDYKCIWYDECVADNEIRNCVSNEPAKLLKNETAEDILKYRCPHFFDNTGMLTNMIIPIFTKDILTFYR